MISPPYDSLSVDRILVGFYEVLFKCFRDCVLFVNNRLKRLGYSWNSARLSRLRKMKSRLFKMFVRSSTDIDNGLESLLL